MCSKNSPGAKQSERSKSIRVRVKKKMNSDGESKQESIKKSSSIVQIRRSERNKTRKKPKYLSLKLELISSHDKKGEKKQSNLRKKPKKAKPKTMPSGTQRKAGMKEKQQLNLFTMHPESGYQYDAVTEYLFNSSAADTSIHDLLDSTGTTSDDGRILSPYHHHPHRHDDRGSSSSASSLVRTAMRRGASSQETAEERWVSYSDVVEEAVLSRSGTPRCGGGDGAGIPPSSLALKLDYDGIMEAWSDKGTLYVDGEPPQTVPDLHADVVMDGCMGNLWAVPEMETAEIQKKGRREESLVRYKEKRQSRLFSKRIRYEVRKLNAEKRPRIKGRFVKRVET